MKSIFLTTLMLFTMHHLSAQATLPADAPALDLTYLVRPPKVAIPHPPALFLFHGAGSNEHDLFSLAVQVPDEWLVISARAPITQSAGHYRWYDVKLVGEKITLDFQQEEASRKRLLQFIDGIVAHYQADSRRVVLAGFSQGANMASVVSLTAPDKVAGFAVFSGRWIEEIAPLVHRSESLAALRCFVAHGHQDHMLPITYATANREALRDLGIEVTFSEDAVGHTISPKLFADFLQWLQQW